MDLDRIRENLARLFLGRVLVRSRSSGMETPETKNVKRTVETHPLRPPARALGTLMYGAVMDSKVFGGVLPFKETAGRVKARLFPLQAGRTGVWGWQFDAFGTAAVKSIKFCGVRVQKDLNKTLTLPQERESRLPFTRGKLPLREGEYVVACNRCGETEADKFGGASMIIGPWGEVLFEKHLGNLVDYFIGHIFISEKGAHCAYHINVFIVARINAARDSNRSIVGELFNDLINFFGLDTDKPHFLGPDHIRNLGVGGVRRPDVGLGVAHLEGVGYFRTAVSFNSYVLVLEPKLP